MFDSFSVIAKTAAVNAAFAGVGHAGDSKMPRCKSNLEPLAWEYFIASHLLRLAEARKKKAQAACVQAGIMFDPEKTPQPVGSTSLVYAGDLVEISVSVTTPSSKVDMPGFCEGVVQAGLKRTVIDRLLAKHTVESRAPHKFTSALTTSVRTPAASR